jgi:hypothetical protein
MFLADDRVFRTTNGRLRGAEFLTDRYGRGRTRAEKGAAAGGTVQANCAGHPGLLAEFRHNSFELLIASPIVMRQDYLGKKCYIIFGGCFRQLMNVSVTVSILSD